MNTRPNPYVGPRSFQAGEPFYGRDRELRSLSALLEAERIVLLHSPSGAGKTSLLQAGLLPRLQAEEFNILPIVRVNQEPPAELAGAAGFNRYTFSTLLSLEEGLPETKRLPVSELASLTLDDYLTRRPRPESGFACDVLVFDQFEEILTIASTDRDSKWLFFEQLGKALRNKKRWALFAIREDYLGALAPYTRPIPGRFAATFRLDLLGVEGAMQAVQKPPQAQGVEFITSVAQKLVDDLRRVHVQLPDGSLEEQLGPSVEPVQMQVVCFRLWQGLAEDDNDINENDLAEVGDVNQSLADYYAASVKSVAEKSAASERSIREWFDRKLITPEGIRGQVLMGAESSDGLPNRVVGLLEDAHIIRGEKRAGKTWYELSHDRMLKPVRENNSAWFQQNLSLLQRQAVLWSQQGRSDGLLLRGKVLSGAEKGLDLSQLLPEEKDFLEACRKLREREKRERQRNTLMTILAIGATIAMIVAGMFYFEAQASKNDAIAQAATAQAASTEAVNQKNEAEQQKATAQVAGQQALDAKATAVVSALEAEKQAHKAEVEAQNSLAGRWVAEANVILSKPNGNAEVATLLILNAAKAKNGVYDAAIEETLGKSLDRLYTKKIFNQHDSKVRVVAYSPDGKRVLIGYIDGTATLCDTNSGEVIKSFSGFDNYYNADNDPALLGVHDVAYSRDGNYFLIASSGGYIQIWDKDFQGMKELHVDSYYYYTNLLWAAEFSPDGKYILVGKGWPFEGPGMSEVWSIETGELVFSFPQIHERFVSSIQISQDGKTVLSTGYDGTAILWDMNWTTLKVSHRQTIKASLPIRYGALSPDGATVAVGLDSSTVALYKVNGILLEEFIGHVGIITSVAYSPDGNYILTSSQDDTARLWDIKTGNTVRIFAAHTDDIWSVVFSPDGQTITTGSFDTTARIWKANPGQDNRTIREHQDSIIKVSFSPDGHFIISSSNDDTIRMWDAGTLEQKKLDMPVKLNDPFVEFSAQGRWLVAHGGKWSDSGGTSTVVIWEKNGDEYQPIKEINYDVFTQIMAFSRSVDGSESKYLYWGRVESDRFLLEAGGSWDTIARIYNIWWWNLKASFTQIASDKSPYLAVTGAVEIPIYRIENPDTSLPFAVCSTPGGPFGTYGSGTIAFSPSGQYLASEKDNNILIWDWQSNPTGAETHECTQLENLPGHTSKILDIAFSPDGKYLLSSSSDGTAILWDVETWQILRILSGHEGDVISVAFSPDSKSIVTGGSDKTIRIWDITYHDTIQRACSLLLRDFTSQERAKYGIINDNPTCGP